MLSPPVLSGLVAFHLRPTCPSSTYGDRALWDRGLGLSRLERCRFPETAPEELRSARVSCSLLRDDRNQQYVLSSASRRRREEVGRTGGRAARLSLHREAV